MLNFRFSHSKASVRTCASSCAQMHLQQVQKGTHKSLNVAELSALMIKRVKKNKRLNWLCKMAALKAPNLPAPRHLPPSSPLHPFSPCPFAAAVAAAVLLLTGCISASSAFPSSPARIATETKATRHTVRCPWRPQLHWSLFRNFNSCERDDAAPLISGFNFLSINILRCLLVLIIFETTLK